VQKSLCEIVVNRHYSIFEKKCLNLKLGSGVGALSGWLTRKLCKCAKNALLD